MQEVNSLQKIDTSPVRAKTTIIEEVRRMMEAKGYTVVDVAPDKPWGAFFRFSDSDTQKFMKEYFPEIHAEDFARGGGLSPKILIVAPDQRLSWQYHKRRAEVGILAGGNAGYYLSDTEDMGERHEMEVGAHVHFHCGQFHRWCGMPGSWGFIAEIWQHTDAEYPSDESDIVRVQDDYQR